MSQVEQKPLTLLIRARLNSKVAPNLDIVHESIVPELEQEFDLDKTDHIVLRNANIDYDPRQNYLTITGQIICVSTNNNNKRFIDKVYEAKDFQPLYVAQSDDFEYIVIENGSDIFVCP